MQLDPLSNSRQEYSDRTYRYPTMVRHQGVAVAFAMDANRQIWYSVLDLTPPATKQGATPPKTNDKDGWSSSPDLLIFPPELAEVGFSAIAQQRMPVFRRSDSTQSEPEGTILPAGDRARPSDFDYFRSTTSHLSADVPFQVLSDGTFIYLFRQSTDDATLLVDRFLLAGRKLVSKLEVRYQRSRRRGVPQNRKDTLAARDLDGNPFIEPTQKLGFIRDLTGGRFSVLLIPTHIASVQRWQIFAENSATHRMDSYNIQRSDDGLFNTQGTDAPTDTRGGESALSLTAATSAVFDGSVPLGSSFTIELWLKLDAAGADEQVLFSDPAQAVVRILGRSRIAVGGKVADGFSAGSWKHLAIAGKAGQLRVYIDGALQDLQDLTPASAMPTVVLRLGGSAPRTPQLLSAAGDPNTPTEMILGCAAVVDDLRIWDRARPAEEIVRDRKRRLTGVEPGLIAYLRFDEARGHRAFDQTRSGHHATIIDPANRADAALWPVSGAPLVEGSGIERQSFAIDGRTFNSPPTALLYFQQSQDIRSGYSGQAKPLKQNGRVMLAVSTRASDTDTTPFIAALDFGVSGFGRIARIPDILPLSAIRATTSTDSINDRLDAIVALETRIRRSEMSIPYPDATVAELAQVRANLARALDPPDVNNPIGVRIYADAIPGPFSGADFAHLNQVLADLRSAAIRVANSLSLLQGPKNDFNAAFARLAPETDRIQASVSQRQEVTALRVQLQTLTNEVRSGFSAGMSSISLDANGLSVAGGLLSFAYTNEAPLLFDSATGKLALYFRGADDQFFVTYYETFTSRARCPLGSIDCIARTTERELDQLTVEVTNVSGGFCDVAIHGAGIDETWPRVPTAPDQFRNVLNGTASRRTKIAEGVFAADGLSLTVSGLTRSIATGTLLVAGDIRVSVAANVAANATAIPLTAAPAQTVPPESRPIYLLSYDYTLAVSSLPGADLENGSSLVFAAEPTGAVPIAATAVTAGATISATWVAAAPGFTISLNPDMPAAALQSSDKLARLNPPDDLALETWVRPKRLTQPALLIDHPSYRLALKPAALNSALVLDSAKVNFRFTASPTAANGAFTVECWACQTGGSGTLLSAGTILTVSVDTAGLVTVTYNGTGMTSAGALGASFRHLAFAVDPATQTASLYLDGALEKSQTVTISTAGFTTFQAGDSTAFQGSIDELRVWAVARTSAQIQQEMDRRLTGNETNLRACWTFTGGQVSDLSRFRVAGTVSGKADNRESPLQGFQATATVRQQTASATEIIPCGSWTHVAASYRRGYAIDLNGRDQSFDCGSSAALNLSGDLTIEVFAEIKEKGRRQFLVRKGAFDDADSAQKPPYALYIDDNDRLVFAFMDVKGNLYQFTGSKTLSLGFHHIAVTRERLTEKDTNPETASDRTSYDSITLYLDGQSAGVAEGTKDVFDKPVTGSSFKYEGPHVGGDFTKKDGGPRSPQQVAATSRSFTIGASGKVGETLVDSFHGSISEVRVWNIARESTQIARRAPLRDDQANLCGWWRFREREGNSVKDSSGNGNDATTTGARWVVSADPLGGAMSVVVNGVVTTPEISAAATSPATAFSIGIKLFGELEDTRIWRTARTPEQIQDNMFGRIADELPDLLAYYTYDPSAADPNVVLDQSLGLNHLAANAMLVISTAPIGEDGPEVRNALAGVRSPFSGFLQSRPAVQEYADSQLDAGGNLIGVFKRVYGYILEGKWILVTGYKVGDLSTEWVGQVQFNPELVGYIEGAPPVPSENLTTVSVDEIGDADDYNGASSVKLIEAEDKTYTFNSTRDAGAKLNVEGSLKFGAGAAMSLVTAPLGVGLSEEILDTEVTGGPKIAVDTQFGWLDESSVAFGLTTAKATSMELRGRFATGTDAGLRRTSRLFLPDNTGQALVKSETADLFALRLRRNGALIAYQFRPNPDIPKDFNIITFRIDPAYTCQGTLDGKVGLEAHPSYPNALEAGSTCSYYNPVEAYKLKDTIARKAADLKTLYDQYDAATNAHLSKFASGSLPDRYRPLQSEKAKRSLANTYVWTADGGLYAETEESSDTFVESTGGSFEFTGGLGAEFEGHIKAPVSFDFQLNLMLSGYYKLEEKKNLESKTAYSLEVDIEKVERDLLLRDDKKAPVIRNGRALRVPGKVDAYRFMTFRLEPATDNFDDFFNKVVDQAWLQSDDPNAVALRGANQPAKKPPCWRVLHRVTFVSRVREEVASGDAGSPLVQGLRQLDIDSNFELIKQFEPYVIDLRHDRTAFVQAIDDRITNALPALAASREDITNFLLSYYGISTVLTAGEDQNRTFGEASFLEQSVNTAPAVAILGAATQVVVLQGANLAVHLAAQVTDDRLTPDAVFLTWSASGPAAAAFSDAHGLRPAITFQRRGRYRIGITADDGKLTGSAGCTVIVNEPPRIHIEPPGEPVKNGASWVLNLVAQLDDDGRADDSADSGRIDLEWTCITAQPQPTFASGGQLQTRVTLTAPGEYLFRITARNGEAVGSADLQVSVAGRATDGLAAFYTFEQGQGTLVPDVSASLNPIDLQFDAARATWVPGGLTLQQSGAVAPAAATALATSLRSAGEFTLEAWVEPAAPPPHLANIITLASPDRVFLSLAQLGSIPVAIVGTAATEPNGSGQALAGGSLPAQGPVHLAATFADFRVRLFINGHEAVSRLVDGDLSSWNAALSAARLTIGDNGWLGTIRMAAIYTRALSDAEVARNVEFGADFDLAPIVHAGADTVLDWADITQPLSLRLAGRVAHDRPTPTPSLQWSQVPQALHATFSSRSVPDPTVTFAAKGRFVFRLSASDGRLQASDDVTVTVYRPPAIRITTENTIGLDGASQTIPLEVVIDDDGAGIPGEPTVTWQSVSGPAVTFSNPSATHCDAVVTQRGAYEFAVTVSNGRLSTTQSVIVHVITRPRVAIDTAVETIALPALALAAAAGGGTPLPPSGSPLEIRALTLDTGAAPGALQFTWSVSGPVPVDLSSASGAGITATFHQSGEYTVQLKAANEAFETTALKTVFANRPPLVDAGADQVIGPRPVTQLAGFIADDGLRNRGLNLQWTAQGPGTVEFENASSAITAARFFQAGNYTLTLTASDGNASRAASKQVQVSARRALENIISFLPLTEAAGADVRDLGMEGAPLLNFAPASSVVHIAGGGLRFDAASGQGALANRATLLSSAAPHTGILGAIRGSRQFSLEVWAAPAVLQGNAGTLLAFSGSRRGLGGPPPNIDFALVQRDATAVLRLRAFNATQAPAEVATPSGSLTHQMTQIVCTVEEQQSGLSVLFYINGRFVSSGTAASRIEDFEDFRFAIGNDVTLANQWAGVLGSVSIYSTKLDRDAVLQNFVAGPR